MTIWHKCCTGVGNETGYSFYQLSSTNGDNDDGSGDIDEDDDDDDYGDDDLNYNADDDDDDEEFDCRPGKLLWQGGGGRADHNQSLHWWLLYHRADYCNNEDFTDADNDDDDAADYCNGEDLNDGDCRPGKLLWQGVGGRADHKQFLIMMMINMMMMMMMIIAMMRT